MYNKQYTTQVQYNHKGKIKRYHVTVEKSAKTTKMVGKTVTLGELLQI